MTAPEQQRDADRAEVRRELDEERIAQARGLPTYEVPAFVAERFPAFDPQDPSTWPEPDRCTNGRPWGHDAYSYSTPGAQEWADRWTRYLASIDRPPNRYAVADRCRNRWKDEESRLCGTHVKPWREGIETARKRLARNARELEHLDLARQIAAYGIEADGFSDSVRLQADAVRALLCILASAAEDRERVEEYENPLRDAPR